MNPLAKVIPNSVMGGAMSAISQISNLKKLLRDKDPNAVVQMLAQKNPQFAQFLSDSKGKTPQQIASEYGLDWNEVQNLMR